MQNELVQVNQKVTSPQSSPQKPGSPKKQVQDPRLETLLTPKSVTRGWLMTILLLSLLVGLGRDYPYDFPQVMASVLISELNIGPFEVSLLYSAYAAPAVFCSPFAGWVIKKIGVHRAVVVGTIVYSVGNAMFYFGLSHRKYHLILLGRAFLGAGGEFINVVQLTICELWFYGSFLSVAYTLNSSAYTMASLLGCFFHPQIYIWTQQLHKCGLVAVFMSGISIIAAVLYVFAHLQHQSDRAYATE